MAPPSASARFLVFSVRIPNNLYQQIEATLSAIFFENRHADKAIEFQLKSQKKWGSRDRRFFAESVYEIVRWWRLYSSLVGCSEPQLRDVHGITQIYFDIKDSSRAGHSEAQRKMQFLKQTGAEAIVHSYPDVLWDLAKDQLQGRWPAIAESLNAPAPVDLRCNFLKTTLDQLHAQLLSEGIETDRLPQGLTLRERKNVFVTQAFQKGLFEVQDRASQLVAPFCQVEPGMRVIDACAGAGGKSLHLATLMRNKGKLLSLDVFEKKLTELRKRASRNGIDCVETKWIENSKVIKRLQGTADRLLLDVPCSGVGVLRRNPDTKWKFQASHLDELRELQRTILVDYEGMLKKDGLLIYATCSVLPSENEEQVRWFLEKNPERFRLQEQIRIDPDQGRGDGFFMARMVKIAN